MQNKKLRSDLVPRVKDRYLSVIGCARPIASIFGWTVCADPRPVCTAIGNAGLPALLSLALVISLHFRRLLPPSLVLIPNSHIDSGISSHWTPA